MGSDSSDNSIETHNITEKEVQQVPTEYNEEQTLRFLRQNQVPGEQRVKTISNIPITATVAEVLKYIDFPADKRKIINFIEQQTVNNPKCNEVLPILQNIDEEKEYHNAFEITDEAGLVE
jgi:hypothetical protein